MELEVITPEKKLFAGDVKAVHLPGSKGGFEMLKNHAPIVSNLSKGIVRIIQDNGEELTYEIKGGVVEGSNNKVTVLTD